MKLWLSALVIFASTGVFAQDSLFDRTHRAYERAQRRDYQPPRQTEGRTGYTERGYRNNSGNDSQSQQLDNLDDD
jgi:hypothetical protein